MIKGIQGTSLLDYPEKISSVIFIGGCNFRCPFCHNPELVRPEDVRGAPNISIKEAVEELKRRSKFIEGVAITGGEPLLFPAIEELIKGIKEIGLSVKVDTNGSFPDRLRRIIPYVDYIAMDLKTSPEKYPIATGNRCNFRKIFRSVEVLLSSDIEYEFRTTLVPGVVDEKDVERIASMIKSAHKYALQVYRPGNTLDPGFVSVSYSRDRMEVMKGIAEEFVENVELRVV